MNSPDPVTRLNIALQGRYRIEREIGEGRMATVYLAKAAMFLLWLAVLSLASGVHAQQSPKPRITILTTGGTIASRPGAVSLAGPELVQAVPQLLDHASITVEEVARTGSSRMTPELWLKIGKRINELFQTDEDLTGVVVTHGTDTMEETAYYLNITVLDERPVVLVGSMRSANAISADGPSNLLDAIRVAANPDARNRGVMIVLNDEINSARAARKTDNQRLQTFRAPEFGLFRICRSRYGSLLPLATAPAHRQERVRAVRSGGSTGCSDRDRLRRIRRIHNH